LDCAPQIRDPQSAIRNPQLIRNPQSEIRITGGAPPGATTYSTHPALP